MVYRVEFLPSGCTAEISENERLDIIAEKAGVAIRHDCGGNGICGKCKVIIDGKTVLACRTNIEIDKNKNSVVVIPGNSNNRDSIAIQIHDFIGDIPAVYGRDSDNFGVAIDIGTTTIAAELHVLNAKNNFTQTDNQTTNPNVLSDKIQQNEDVRACVPIGKQAVRTENSSEINLKFPVVVSCINPQHSYGDDVIARIQRVIEESSFLAIFQALVVRAINELLESLAESAGINVTEITRISAAGNTVMEQIFLGIDPSSLGYFPFKPICSEFPECLGSEIGINISDSGKIETLPILGGFVGGDLTAGILSLGMWSDERTTFLIDIGTNGELVLCHGGEFYAAATAAGPALEGGRIEYGMLAAPGAIDHVTIDKNGLNFSTIANAKATGICGSGLIDIVSEMLKNNLLLATGKFNVTINSPFLNRWKIVEGRPVFIIATENESGRLNEPIVITQKDIRQVQLAVGAIKAGIKLLLRYINLNVDDISTFYIAGGFGSFIKLESAQKLGLVPPELSKDRIKICGNTSLAGARMALFDDRVQNITKSICCHSHTIDLSTFTDFAQVFTEQMIF
ncbi:MAG: ASKHA domain-containing protein [Planctomycetaceae bacterium]|jgi:uncharacterized 2Fe-2S/4Fe-4S cluster protein (DUF4445 family)|nr:ASKHA domain-containing protein [Planctomycetaceae bacterium]